MKYPILKEQYFVEVDGGFLRFFLDNFFFFVKICLFTGAFYFMGEDFIIRERF